MLESLKETRLLWVAFAATIGLTLAFPIATGFWDLSLVDSVSDPEKTRMAIAAMTPEQRAAHAWITATLDLVYPLAYGALLVGSALAFFPRIGPYLAWVLVWVIPVDLLEGLVQVLALMETLDVLGAKRVLTPLKFALFFAGAAVMVLGWGRWLLARLRGGAA